MRFNQKYVYAILFGVMLLAVQGLIWVRQLQVEDAVEPDLERLLDIHPDNWEPLQSYVTSPAWKKSGEREYDCVAARSYQDECGRQITIVMTWSRNGLQRAGHIQQLCYVTQGHSITNPRDIIVALPFKKVIMTTFSAERLGGEVEDVFYWRVTGGKVIENILGDKFGNYLLSHRLLKLKENFRYLVDGIPSNIMVRVTSVRSKHEQPSDAPLRYIEQYVALLSPSDRQLLLGD